MAGKQYRDWLITARNRSVWLLVVGDTLAIFAFLAYGLTRHGIDPLQFPRHTALTALPFVLSWLLLAPTAGLYRSRTFRSARSTLVRTTAVWIGVSLVGSAMRSTSYLPGGAPPEFLLVVVVFGVGTVLPWRFAVVLTEHVRHNYQGGTGRIDRT